MAAYLEVRAPQGQQRLALEDEPLTIGRQAGNKLVLAEPMASRNHCVVEKVPEGFRVRDLNSSNGTRLNGQAVRTSLLLPGDRLQIGRVEMTLVIQPDPPDQDAEVLGEDALVDEDEVSTPPARKAAAPHNDPWANDPDEARATAVDRAPAPAVEIEEAQADHEEILLRLAESLPDKSFDDADIALITARGNTAHAARGAGDRARSVEQAETVTLLRLILLICFRIRASDIHVEPKEMFWQVRIRVDGNMVDVVRLNKALATRLISLVKVLSDIDIAQRGIIQEGHFSSRLPDRRVDYRVSFAPAMYGQKLVMRILDTANSPLRASDLKMPEWMSEQIRRATELEAGMVLVCGPTGSGKTTTLYALLRSLDTDQRNVVTIEDPVEIEIPGVTQIPVNEAQGNSFSALLRSILRQDPDVILVGEIRDPETAKIAMQAAITGHLVFSTVHTRDTIGTIFRLLDLGVEPYMLVQGLHLVLSQRLVRNLCPYCKVPVQLTPEQLTRMQPHVQQIKEAFGKGGCPRCLGTGYAGRRALCELLTTTEELREVILKNPTTQDIQKALAPTHCTKLITNGYQLVANGVTSLDEVERTVGV